MGKKLLLLFVALLTLGRFMPGAALSNQLHSVLAAPPAVEWTKTFGGANEEKAHSIQKTTDGGYVITGYTKSLGAGNWDVYLVKTDALGNLTWQRTFGGVGDDRGYSVQQTADGGYIVAGSTLSFGSGGDVYLVKADASGNQLWQKTFGGVSYDFGQSVQQTAGGGYIITGGTDSFGAGSRDVYLIRTDASGNLTWQKTFGGANDDQGHSVQQTTDGGYVITGQSTSFGNGWTYLVKTDASGNLTWQRTFGENSGWGNFILQTADSGYIIAGVTGSGNWDAYLIKTDYSGNLMWQQTFGGASYEEATSVRQTIDGNYVVTGWTGSFGADLYDVYLSKIDALGNMAWQQTYGGTSYDRGYSVQLTAEGGYIIAGETSSFGAGGYDIYLIKLGPETLLPGDANGDGVVNALDITKIERIIIGLDAPTAGADANQDGNINAIDITWAERRIAGLN